MADNPFGTAGMAGGYATSRPPVHPQVVRRAFAQMSRPLGFQRALDIGCGAGLSTRALEGVAHHRVGIEPAVPMLRWTGSVAPQADFLAGAAEALPIASRSADLITAAGSLNYTDLSRFFPEAERVLVPAGAILVYDFSPGRTFVSDDSLDRWFADFVRRYPWPASEARPLSPDILAALDNGFHVRNSEHFRIALPITYKFYLDYMMTETNVAFAIRNGESPAAIRSWCAETLRPLWSAGPRDVIFSGYFAMMARAGDN